MDDAKVGRTLVNGLNMRFYCRHCEGSVAVELGVGTFRLQDHLSDACPRCNHPLTADAFSGCILRKCQMVYRGKTAEGERVESPEEKTYDLGGAGVWEAYQPAEWRKFTLYVLPQRPQ